MLIVSIIIVFIISFFLCGCTQSETKTDTKTDDNIDISSFKNKQIGESVSYNGLYVSVSSAEKPEWIWANKDGQYPDNGKYFVEIRVYVSYHGTGSVYISPSDFYIISSFGTKNTYDYFITSTMNGGLESAWLYSGEYETGNIVYQIPDFETASKIRFNVGTYSNAVIVEWDLNF